MSNQNKDLKKEGVEKEGNADVETNKRFLKKNVKYNYRIVSLDPKTFTGETVDMNGQLFQTIEESKDATQ